MKNKKKKKTANGVYKMEKEKEFPLFENKLWYKGKFEEHEEGTGQYGPILFCKFKILSGEMEDGTDAKGQTCMAMLPAELNPKSKLYEFVRVLEGSEIDIDDEIDIKAYYGQKVQVFIENAKKKRDNGKLYQNVTEIKKMKKKKKR